MPYIRWEKFCILHAWYNYDLKLRIQCFYVVGGRIKELPKMPYYRSKSFVFCIRDTILILNSESSSFTLLVAELRNCRRCHTSDGKSFVFCMRGTIMI